MIVSVRKAKANNWLGVLNYVGSDTKIGPPLDQFGQAVTGLNYEEEAEFEEKLNLPKGTLSKRSPFWDTYVVVIGDKTLVLDTSIPEHELQYKFLKAQKKVAKSMNDLRTNANAVFVIFAEEEEAKIENKKFKAKSTAYQVFGQMSTADMKQVLMLFNKLTDTASPEVIENTLIKIVEDDPNKFLDIVQDEKLKLKVFIAELVRYGILEKSGVSYTLNGDMLAHDQEAMIYYLENKENNSMFKSLKDQLARAKK